MKLYLFLSLVICGGAVIQENILHDSFVANRNNSYIFRTHVPDTTILPLANVVRHCHNGGSVWVFYNATNYLGEADIHSTSNSICHNTTASFSGIKSFRFVGNELTDVDGVSLYPQTELRGAEIYINHSPYGNIVTNISSLGYTGKSAWTLFEGINFEGNTSCLPARNGTAAYYYTDITSLNITDVGSLMKGCVPTVSPKLRATLRLMAIDL